MANVNGVLTGSASLLEIDFDAVLRGLPDPHQHQSNEPAFTAVPCRNGNHALRLFCQICRLTEYGRLPISQAYASATAKFDEATSGHDRSSAAGPPWLRSPIGDVTKFALNRSSVQSRASRCDRSCDPLGSFRTYCFCS